MLVIRLTLLLICVQAKVSAQNAETNAGGNTLASILGVNKEVEKVASQMGKEIDNLTGKQTKRIVACVAIGMAAYWSFGQIIGVAAAGIGWFFLSQARLGRSWVWIALALVLMRRQSVNVKIMLGVAAGFLYVCNVSLL